MQISSPEFMLTWNTGAIFPLHQWVEAWFLSTTILLCWGAVQTEKENIILALGASNVNRSQKEQVPLEGRIGRGHIRKQTVSSAADRRWSQHCLQNPVLPVVTRSYSELDWWVKFTAAWEQHCCEQLLWNKCHSPSTDRNIENETIHQVARCQRGHLN